MEQRDRCLSRLEKVLSNKEMEETKKRFAEVGNSLDYAWIGKLKDYCDGCHFAKELEEESFCTNQVLFAKMTQCSMQYKVLNQEVYNKRSIVYEFLNNSPLAASRLGYLEMNMDCLMCPNSVPIDNLLYCGNSNLIDLMEDLNNEFSKRDV